MISVLGAGSWGTALAKVLAENGHNVEIFVRNAKTLESINSHARNDRYLKDISLPNTIHASMDLNEVISDAQIIIFAIPTQNIRSVLDQIPASSLKGKTLVNVSKGIEIGTNMRISQVFENYCDPESYVVLSGPSHAEEVAIRMPTAVVAASKDMKRAERVQDLFMSPYFRVYTSSDVIGVELGGALKNILAVGLGIADGLSYGDNTKAAIMTRGLHEMVSFGINHGGRPETFYGLTGIGDLIVTSTSRHSRNRRAGILIGEGHTLEQTTAKIDMVVEGIKTLEAVYDIAKQEKIEMPITEEIYRVAIEGKDVRGSVNRLMGRDRKLEARRNEGQI